MTEARQDRRDGGQADERPGNPTDEELDVEGPNESAPGHEPPEGRAEGGDPAPDAESQGDR
jgi:hypothetical protein